MSDNGNNYPPSLTLTRFYEHTSKKGTMYLADRLGFASVVVLKTNDTTEDGTPIWTMKAQEAPAKKEGEQPRQQQQSRDGAQVRHDWQRPSDSSPRQATSPSRKFDADIPF